MDQTLFARKIEAWPNTLGVKLPASVTDKLAVLEALRYADPIDTETPEDITPDNVAGILAQQATHLAIAAQEDNARRAISNKLVREVRTAALAAASDIAEQLQPRVKAAGEALREAVAKLPEDMSDAAMVKAGGETVDAYHAARQAGAELAAYAGWVADLEGSVAVGGSREHRPALRVTRPSSISDLNELIHANTDKSRATNAVRTIGAVYYTAAVNGIEFRLMLPAEGNALVKTLEAEWRHEQEAKKRQQMM